MILNISLAGNNVIYYYEIKRNSLEEEYVAYSYRIIYSKIEDILRNLKDIINEKKDITADFFISKLSKTFRCEQLPTKSFSQIISQVIPLINSYGNELDNLNLRHPIAIATLYLNKLPSPKIEKIKLIDNNIYFIIKYKSEYIMHEIDNENIECIIPLSNIFKIYKRLKKVNRTKTNIRKKRTKKENSLYNSEFTFDEMVTPIERCHTIPLQTLPEEPTPRSISDSIRAAREERILRAEMVESTSMSARISRMENVETEETETSLEREVRVANEERAEAEAQGVVVIHRDDEEVWGSGERDAATAQHIPYVTTTRVEPEQDGQLIQEQPVERFRYEPAPPVRTRYEHVVAVSATPVQSRPEQTVPRPEQIVPRPEPSELGQDRPVGQVRPERISQRHIRDLVSNIFETGNNSSTQTYPDSGSSTSYAIPPSDWSSPNNINRPTSVTGRATIDNNEIINNIPRASSDQN